MLNIRQQARLVYCVYTKQRTDTEMLSILKNTTGSGGSFDNKEYQILASNIIYYFN